MKLYNVTVNGLPHTMQLDAADAKRYGGRATKVPGKEERTAEQARQLEEAEAALAEATQAEADRVAAEEEAVKTADNKNKK